MNLVTGKDLFESELGRANVILVTTNSTLDRKGRLVMGAGAAKQAVRWSRELGERRPLPESFGAEIRRSPATGGKYGVIILPGDQWAATTRGVLPTCWGAFQVKRHWRDDADLDLIENSCTGLYLLAGLLPAWRFAMNYPGIGAGRLPEFTVEPILDRLPDNVWVYRHGS